MFDLPVDTKEARRNYTEFRRFLLTDGFQQLQYSVYGRHCPSQENATVHIKRVERHLPPDGEVRVLQVTEKQFERMLIYFGKNRSFETPQQTDQLLLF